MGRSTLPVVTGHSKKKYIYPVTSQSIQKYLERINIHTVLIPNRESLYLLQMAHLMNVPFENIDIFRGIPIDLSNSFHKIVDNRRGGFCYELNSQFYELLSGIGFTVKMISARVRNDKGEFGPEFDHMALIVSLEEEYLVDVGFGDFSILPLKFTTGTDLVDSAGTFSIEKHDEKYFVVKKRNDDGEFIPFYLFTTLERSLEDFMDMCNYHQSSPDSHFAKGLICTILTETGRITLTDKFLKILSKDIITKSESQHGELQQKIHEYFGMHVEILESQN